MTYEEKIEYLKAASPEELLNLYEECCRILNENNPLLTGCHDYEAEGNYELVYKELLHRMEH